MSSTGDDKISSDTVAEFLAVFTPTATISAVFFILFCYLRTKRPEIYAPRATWLSKYYTAPRLPDGYLTWIPALFAIEDDYIIKNIGMDAFIYLKFLGTGFKLFILSSFVGIAMVIPTNTKGERVGEVDGFEKLSMASIDAKSGLLWVHVVGCYLISGIFFYLFRNTYNELVPMIQEYKSTSFSFRTDGQSNTNTILVSALPEKLCNEKKLADYFRRLYPMTFYKSMLAVSLPGMEDLLKEFREDKEKLEHAQAEFKETGERPEMKTKMCGDKVDAIEHLTNELNRLKKEIEDTRNGKAEPMTSAFVTFKTKTAAAQAAQCVHAVKAMSLAAKIAPEPRDVYWPNLRMDPRKQALAQTLVKAASGALIVYWAIPVAMTATLGNLDSLAEQWSALEPVADIDPAAKGIIQGLLPTVLLVVLMIILQMILRRFAILEGVDSFSAIDSRVFDRFFFFLVFNVFLVTTLSGSLIAALSEVIDDPASIFSLLGESLPTQATFFVNFVILRGLGEPFGVLLNIGLLVKSTIFQRIGKTEREKLNAQEPGGLDYGGSYSNNLLIIVIVLAYSIIAPIILPFGAMYFGLYSLSHRYNLLNVYTSNYETGGTLWHRVFKFSCIGLLISQITLIGLMALKEGFQQGPCLIPLPIITIYFMGFYEDRYKAMIEQSTLAMEVAVRADEKHPTDEAHLEILHERYTQPEMYMDLDQVLTLEAERFRGRFHVAHTVEPTLEDLGVEAPKLPDGFRYRNMSMQQLPLARGDSDVSGRSDETKEDDGDDAVIVQVGPSSSTQSLKAQMDEPAMSPHSTKDRDDKGDDGDTDFVQV